MKTKPILFSTPMVQAILEGRKTQTRRVVKYKKKIENPKIGYSAFTNEGSFSVRGKHENGEFGESFFKMPIQKGDILWVRETFAKLYRVDENGYTDFNKELIFYRADGEPDIVKYDADGFELENQFMKWKPSIFMPKEACRLFLEVTNVRIERLQDISERDAVAEGIELTDDFWGTKGARNYMYGTEKGFRHEFFFPDASYGIEKTPSVNGVISSFFTLIASIHSWDLLQSNPFVWVYDFKILERPENFI